MAYKRISPQPVIEGGTGAQTFTAYSVIAAGTTANGPLQNVVGVGTSGQVLTSAGAGALPAWQTLGGASISITGDTGGALVGGAFTFTGGTTGLSFNGAVSTFTTTFAGITANGGTVSLATDATASTVDIGTGAGAKTVTLGSTNTTSTTNLQSGSGGIKIPAFAEGALVTSNTGVISTVTGTAGFVLTANAAGTAPSFQAAGGGGGGTTWSVITADQTAAVNNGYICNKAGLLTLTLPTTAAAGTLIEVTGINTALGWKIAQNASQQIHFGTVDTTSGTGGSLASSATRDSIKLVCVVADLEWNVLSSMGNVTYV